MWHSESKMAEAGVFNEKKTVVSKWALFRIMRLCTLLFGDLNCRAQEIWLHELHSDGGRKEIWLDGLASKSSLA